MYILGVCRFLLIDSFIFMTFLALAVSHSAYAQQRQISHVDISGNWLHTWDKTGKRLSSRAAN